MSSLSCEAGVCSKPSPMHTAVGVHRLRGEAPWRKKVRQYFSTRGQHYGFVDRVFSGVMARSPSELCYHTFTRGGSGLAIGVPSPPCGGRLRPPTLSSYGVLGAPPLVGTAFIYRCSEGLAVGAGVPPVSHSRPWSSACGCRDACVATPQREVQGPAVLAHDCLWACTIVLARHRLSYDAVLALSG